MDLQNLSPKQKRKLEKVAKVIDEGNLAVVEHLFEIEENFESKTEELNKKVDNAVEEIKSTVPNINDLLEQVKGKDGEDGEDASPEDVANILRKDKKFIDSLKGEKGDVYNLTESDKEKIVAKIKVPVVEKIIERTEVIKELPTITQVVDSEEIANLTAKKIEDSLPQYGEVFRDGLELLPEGEKLKMSAIQDLIEKLNAIESAHKVIGANRNLYQLLDVNISGINTGQGIMWNGQQWVPFTPINAASIISEEVPTGSGTNFTLAHTPLTGTLKLYRGGARQQAEVDYTLSGANITLAVALSSGEVLLADYNY